MAEVLTYAAYEKLMEARCRLMTREPWYGHIAMAMEWKPSDMSWIPEPQRRTMGVRIVNNGVVECIFYPPFVEGQTMKQLYGAIHHEIEHLVRLHCLRVGHRDSQGWNLAADMCVNGRKNKPRIGYPEDNGSMTLPLDGGIVFIPDGWDENSTAEDYYSKLEKAQGQSKTKCVKCGGTGKTGAGQKGKKGKKDKGDKGDKGEGEGEGEGQGEGQGQGQGEGQGQGQGEGQGQGQGGGGDGGKCPNCDGNGEGCGSGSGTYGYGGVEGQVLDDHSVWNQSDVSEDEARQVVKDMVEQATQKCQGQAPGHLIEAIKKLGKPVVRWREELRRFLGTHVGNRRKTYSRRNRRYDQFGLPGVSHHAACRVHVIVDTSGSISTKELEQFFAEIDMIASRAKIHVLQWDYDFQSYDPYRRGDWKKWNAKGRGGTDMAKPVYWLEEHVIGHGDVVVCLTDGYCNWPEKKSFPYVVCLTKKPDKGYPLPKWGQVVLMDPNQ